MCPWTKQLHQMSNMIYKLQIAGHILIDEQQVQEWFVLFQVLGTRDNSKMGKKKRIGKQGANTKFKFHQRGKKNMTKVKYFNCNKKGHFVRDSTEPKKVCPEPFDHNIFASNCLFLTESKPV